jgi:asparagine synthase (glutamine-hydrolysing)
MCGIAGWLARPGSEPKIESLRRMIHLIRHRGPDDRGEYLDPAHGLALGHLRLSIIDLSAASHQPLVDAGSGVVLIFNGEIYNFRALRAELQAAGFGFESSGDGEVLLKAYLHWGIGCLDRLAGMFAIALWDPRERRLHLARDPLGMKPLYYRNAGGALLFASEIKALVGAAGASARVSDAGLQQYLEFGYVFAQGDTIFEGVRKLEPGTRMQVEADGERRIVRYYTPAKPLRDDSRDEAARVEEAEQILSTVTAEHLISDVPLGLLLSGGLDSSLVAALAARTAPLLTISMGFGGSGVDERPHARAVAEHIGSRHVEVLLEPAEVMAEIDSGAWVFDDLFADWGTITTRLLYRKCREAGVKVVLVGEGADELFGGYDIFRTPARLGLWHRFRLYQRYAGRRHGQLFGAFNQIMQEYLDEAGGDPFEAVRAFETRRQLPNQYVMKVDKASMAESIEARAPYLDRRVADLAFRTPGAWLLRGDQNKYLLRALARKEGLLPAATPQRPKFGGSIAISWMDDHVEFRRFARERLLGGTWARSLGLHKAFEDFFDRGKEGYAFPHSLSHLRNVAWRVLLLEVWSRHYLERAA